MKTFLYSHRLRGLLAVVAVFLSWKGAAQTPAVRDYTTFTNALATSTVINNFVIDSTISVGAGQTFQITRDTVIDAGGQHVVIDGGKVARLFTVHPACQLTLINLQMQNAQSALGSAIYNEGVLVISNCIFWNNAATNVMGLSGAEGTTNSAGGGSGANGGSVVGGAIYSLGPLSVYNSVFETNYALAGAGGTGGDGLNTTATAYAGYGGNAGAGGSANGAAIYSSGSSNVFVATEFLGNTALGGNGGVGGAAGGNSSSFYYDGASGQGGAGGNANGGAVFVTGSIAISNCVFVNNAAYGGGSGAAAGAFDGFGYNGIAGGEAEGGGLFIASTAPVADIENSIFFENDCIGGTGGAASASFSISGDGGSVAGAGIAIGATAALIRNCTCATNTLFAGSAGSDSGTNGATGLAGAMEGADILHTAGVTRLAGSILSGKSGNAYGVVDAGYNVSSDASPVAAAGGATLHNADSRLDSGMSAQGGPTLGPAGVAGPTLLTLALLPGTPAAGVVQGVPGITFPVADERGFPRGTPASAGAFEVTNDIITVFGGESPAITSDPQNQTATLGRFANFFAAAAPNAGDTNTLGYQWQLNGVNLYNGANFAGVNTTTLTIGSVATADLGAYQLIASPSVFDGVVTSAVAYLLVNLPTTIRQQPASHLNVPKGSVVVFKVVVSGSPPFYYQWLRDGTPLSDGSEISGSTTTNLTINPATAADVGSYSVMVTNFYANRNVTSGMARLTVIKDTARPHVTITAPAANARTTNNFVYGLATDNAQVTNVNCWITNIFEGVSNTSFTTATLALTGTTSKTWAVSNMFLPGTNIVAVQSADYSGNLSPVVTRKFFYIVPSHFGFSFTGSGTVIARSTVPRTAQPTNGAMLNIGQGYTLIARPGHDFLLTNWISSDFVSNAATLQFTMTRNLVIQANFILSPYLNAAGPYNGLFFHTNDITTQTAGMLSGLKVGPLGAYSGRLLLGGAVYPLTGTFDIFGHATNHFARPVARGGSFGTDMTLQWTNGQIFGVVSGLTSAWQSPLYAEANGAADDSGESTMLLTTTTNGVGEPPPATGYILVTNHNGNVVLAGATPDGAAFSQSVPLSSFGHVPIYKALYGNAGLLLGWVTLTNNLPMAGDGLSWSRPAALRSPFYPAGFTNTLAISGSPWTNDIPASGTLNITNDSVALSFPISINGDTLTDTSGEVPALRGAINPRTGLVRLTIPAGRAAVPGYAALLSNTTNLGGYFLTRTNTGLISSHP